MDLSSASRSASPYPLTTITLQPSVTSPVGEDMTGRADDDAGAVLHLALGQRTGHARPRRKRRGNGVNALDITTATGSMMVSVAWS